MSATEAKPRQGVLLLSGRQSRRAARREGLDQRAGRLAAPHRGVIVVIALACVAAASVVMMLAARRALDEWKLVRAETQRIQCRWLAESAVERAAARLASDPKYAGEIWKIPASVLTGREDGERAAVAIEVDATAKDAGRRVVRVRADWPENAPARTRVSKQVTIEIR